MSNVVMLGRVGRGGGAGGWHDLLPDSRGCPWPALMGPSVVEGKKKGRIQLHSSVEVVESQTGADGVYGHTRIWMTVESQGLVTLSEPQRPLLDSYLSVFAERLLV